MTFARAMAHRAQDRWLNGSGGHAEALEAVEATIGEVVEACARAVEHAGGPIAAEAAAVVRAVLTLDAKAARPLADQTVSTHEKRTRKKGRT